MTVPLDPDGEVVINHIRAIIGGTEQLELILMGVALACIMVMCCVCAMHYRLRQEHAALEKDKIMGGSLRRMWNRYIHILTLSSLYLVFSVSTRILFLLSRICDFIHMFDIFFVLLPVS